MSSHNDVVFVVGSGASAASRSPKIEKAVGDPPLGGNMGKVLNSLCPKLTGNCENLAEITGIAEAELCSWGEFCRASFPNLVAFLNDHFFRTPKNELQYNFEYLWTLADIHQYLKEDANGALERYVQSAIKGFIFIVLKGYYSHYDDKYYMALGDFVVDHKCFCISYNWDTLLEQTIHNSKQLAYDSLYGQTVSNMSTGIYRGYFHAPAILKPHGSLNWYKNAHNKLEFSNSLGISEVQRIQILPPTFYKVKYMDEIWGKNAKGYKDLFNKDCGGALSQCDTLAIIGYSFPAFDLESEYLFRRLAGKVKRVFVLDPDAEKIERRIINIFGDVELVRKTLGFEAIEDTLREL
jgi:hypothetical protein